MPINNKVKQLYDTMKAGGADVGTEQEFNDYFFAKGNQGYANRKAVYDTFKANGADVGANYEEFAGWLGLRAANQTNQPQQKQASMQEQNTPWSYQAAKEKAKNALNPRPAQVPSPEDYLHRPEMTTQDIVSGDALKQTVNKQREKVAQVSNTGVEKLKQEEVRQQQPIVNTGTPADQSVVKTQGQWENELSQSVDNILDKKIADEVGASIAQADDAFYRTLQNQPMAMGAGQIYQIPALKQANEASSPEKALETLVSNADQRFKEYFSQPETIEKIKQQADALGINPDDYINQVVLPQVKGRLESAFEQSQIAKHVPKSHLEYLLGEFGGSLGTLMKGAIYTKKQRQYEQAGAQRFAEERGGGVLGAAEDAARMGIGMATDPLMYASGGAAGAATKAIAGTKLGGKILGDAGVKAASRFANGSVAQRMFSQAPQMMFSQGLNLGTYMGTSNVINNYSVGDDTSFGNNAKLFMEGFRDGGVMGGVLGLLGSMTRGLGANIGIKAGDTWWQKALHGTEKGLYNIGALGVEGLGFHTAEELNNYLRGDGFEITPEGTLNGAITAGVLKLTSGHNLSDVGKGIAKRDFGSRFGGKLMQFLSPDVNTGLKITDADRQALSFLGDVDTVMKSIKTKEDAAGLYKQVMENPEVPFDTKQKFSAFTVGEVSNSKPIWQRLDWNEGDSVLKTRDKDGNVVDRFEFKDADERNQKIQELTDERNNQLMLNNLGKHYSKMALEMPELKAKILEKMGYEPEAGADDVINQRILQSVQQGGVNEEMFIEALTELGQEMQASGRQMEDMFVKSFAQEYGMSEEDLLKVAHKDYRDRTPEEQEMMRDFGKRLNDELNPPDEVHPEQSLDNGRAKADETAPDEVINPDSAREVTQTLLEARRAYEQLLDSHGLSHEEMEKMDYPERAQYIYDNFGDEEGAKSIIRLWNAELEHQGYFDRIREKTEEAADLMLNEMQFKGTVDGEPTQDIITVRDADGNEYTLVSGDVSFKDGVMSPDSPSGMIIVKDSEGHPISMKPSRDLSLVSADPRDVKRAQLLENIQVDASNTYLMNGGSELDQLAQMVQQKLSVKPKEGVKPPLTAEQSGNLDNAGGKAGAENGTGANEPPASAPAIDRIPKDEGGNPLYEQAAPEDTYDAFVEQVGENTAKVLAKKQVDTATKALEKLNKKMEKGDFEGNTIQEQIASSQALQQQIAATQATINYWNQVLAVPNNRILVEANNQPVAGKNNPPAAPETPAGEAPEWRYDTPEAARGRGYKVVEGQRIDRQEEKPMPQGKEVEVQYSTKDSAKGRMTVSELDKVQGSHTMNGQKNEMHFIPEAQPKSEFGADRQQKAMTNATEDKFRPDLMLTFNDTQSAYQSSATQTNRRGEVIQGNGRRNLAEYIYAPGNEAVAEKYRQYLMEHAGELGTTAEEIAKMEKPFAHIVLDVNDAEAIRLGQFKASDLESGGKEIPEVSTVTTKLGDKYGSFTNIVLRHDDPDASLAERIEGNAEEAVTWLNKAGVISETEAKTLLGDKAAARQFVKDMLTDTLFRGANDNLRSSFYELPKNIQSAIVSVVGREAAMNGDTSILKEVQASIQAYHELSAASEQFSGVKGRNYEERKRQADVAVEDWLRQINLDGSLNTEKFSNFALELAKRYKSHTDQKSLAGLLRDYYDLVNGSTREASMFDTEATTGNLTREEAIKKVFGIDYKPLENKENGRQRTVSVAGDNQEGQAGGRGESGRPESGEREESGAGTSDRRGGNPVDAGEVKLQKAPIYTSDPIEAISQAAQSFNEERQQKADKKSNKKPSEQNKLIRDVIVKHLIGDNGIEVVTDAKRGQQRLDEVNKRNKKLAENGEKKATYKPSKKSNEEQVEDSRSELQKREDLRNDNQSKVIFEHSKNHFGTTYDIREAGYVLPDGSMLDFSGRHQMNPGSDTSFLKGRRTSDHREISSIGWSKDGDTKTGIETNMSDFIRRGGIRIDDNAGTINLYMKPTKEQMAALRVLVRRNNGTVQIDFGDGWDSEHYVEYEDASPSRIMADIERYYDEGIKPEGNIKYFKTRDGQAFGYTVNGKIYIDPKIATSETPIHEYTHLWADMKRKTSPEEWEDIKKVLLNDEVVEPFIKKVKKEYPELETEDDFIEEVLTQFSGRQGAEKLRKIAEEIQREDGGKFTEEMAETAVQKIKNVLERFWQGVAKMLGVKYTNAEDIADRVLHDLLSGMNPNEVILNADSGADKAQQQKAHKEAQFDIISKANPAADDYHTWIRSAKQILTFKQAVRADEVSNLLDVGKGRKEEESKFNENAIKKVKKNIENALIYRIGKSGTKGGQRLDIDEADIKKAIDTYFNSDIEEEVIRGIREGYKRANIYNKLAKQIIPEYGKIMREVRLEHGMTDKYIDAINKARSEVVKAIKESVDELSQQYQKLQSEFDSRVKRDDPAPDYTAEMQDKALESGKITVYSSKPIEDGAFVTPSKMEAQNYAGDGKVYSKEVGIDDVAWIDQMQGQYAKVEDKAKLQKGDSVTEDPMKAIENAAEDFRKEREEKLNNHGEETESEKKDVSLPQNNVKYEEGDRERVFAGNEAVMRTVAEASDTGVRDSSTEEVGRGSGSKESVLRSLVQRAQENGTWRDSIDDEVVKYIGEGQENHVYLSKDGQHVIKLNNFKFVPKDATDLSAFVDRLRAHNELFPADAMELLGFTENANGEVSAIIRQPFVDAEREATDAEIDKYLEDRDFTVDMNDEWSDGKYGIIDLKPSNVLVDKNGRLRFVDVVVRDMDRQKKVTKFRNPEYREDKSSEPQPVENRSTVAAHVNTLKATLGEKIDVVDSVEGITNEKVKKDIEDGKKVMGWYDPKTGQVSLYMPNIPNSYEAEKTVWHETVGHKGMRELLGEEGYKKYMTKLWLDDKNTELGEYVKERMDKGDMDIYSHVNEWLGEQAEKEVKNPYENASMWQKVREAMSDGLRVAGYKLSPSIMDVKYMTWLSEQNKKGKVSYAKKQAMLEKLMGEKYDTNTYNNKVYRNPGESEDDVEYRLQSGGGNTPLSNLARQRYRDSLYTKQFAWEEAHYNYMAAWKRLQDAIANGQKIPDHMNALMQENELDSKVKTSGEIYVRDICKPYQDIINECIAKINVNKPDEGYQDLEDYMYMKTGLQVNRQVYVRDWLRDQKKKGNDVSTQEQEWYQLKADLKRDVDAGTKTLRDYYTELDSWIHDNVNDKYIADEHDASGLTAFNGAPDGKSYDDADILDRVMNMENQLGKPSVDKLWDQTRRVTDFALDTEYAGGNSSKESIEAAKAQYDWYLPLRGFDEKTAEDMWSYLNNYGSGTSGKILVDRKGRKSKADTPIATAFYLGEQAIRRAAQNQVKMAALRFARQFTDPTDPNSLITEADVWVHNIGTDTNPDWVVEYPNIKPDATPDEVAQEVANFKAQMQAYQQAGTAKKLRTVKTENIPYRFENNRNVSEHIIDVKVNGEDKLLIINDNPRAAQALNGILKPQATKGIAAVNRFLSQAYTSWSPTFVARNAIRDVEFASSMLSVKEGWGYCGDFSKNYASLTIPAVGGTGKPRIFDLFMKHRRGTLDVNDPIEKMFKEFVENGGVTGYIQENNIDKWHNDIMKGVKDIQKGGVIDWTKDKWHWFWDGVEKMGESVENAARFATYMTSRQGGNTHAARTIIRSVADAKEVSVNFNRKGAGWKTSTFKNAKGEVEWNTKLAAATGQYLRDTSLFYNATIQGIMNSYKNAQKRPIGFAAKFATPPLIVGALIPLFNQWVHDMFDDPNTTSDNPYADLAEYDRRGNLCIYIGNNNFIKLPLSLEHKAFYGIGDIAAGLFYDPKLRSVDKPLAVDVIHQMSTYSPVDYTDTEIGMDGIEGRVLGVLTPAFLKPFAQAHNNMSWTGRPIQKENKFNGENTPEYQKAYEGKTTELAVDLSNMWHGWWGGDEVRRAGQKENVAQKVLGENVTEAIGEYSPAKQQYLIEQGFGEAGKLMFGLASGVYKIGKDVINGKSKDALSMDDFNTRMIPVSKAFFAHSNEQQQFYRAKTKYFRYLEKMKDVEYAERGYKKAVKEDPMLELKKQDFEKERAYKQYEVYKRDYKKDLDRLYKQIKEEKDKERKDSLKMEQNLEMQSMVNALDAIE